MDFKYIVETSMSINRILCENFEFSTRLKNKLIKNKLVLRNGNFEDTRTIANVGDEITIILSSPEENENIVPTKMNLDIVYEDEHLLVINKPAGIAVHPSILHFDDSLSNGVRYYFDIWNRSNTSDGCAGSGTCYSNRSFCGMRDCRRLVA